MRSAIRLRRHQRRSIASLVTMLAVGFGATTAGAQVVPKVPAWAKVKVVKTVLFPIESAQIPSLTREVVELSQALGRKVQLASLSPEEVMLVVGCNTYSVACLQKVGKMIKTPALILGKVSPQAGRGVHLRFRRFDVVSGGDAGKVEVDLPLAKVARRSRLLAALRALFGLSPLAPKAAPPPKESEVLITCSAPNAMIFFDGQPRGAAPLVLSGLPPGTYVVRAVKRGYDDWKGKVVVSPGHIHRLRIMLHRRPGAPVEARGFFGSVQAQTWIMGGLALTSMAIGIGFAADLGSRQNEFDRIEGNTPFEILELQDLKDTGDRDALVANVMFVVGGALLATTGLLAYLDFRRGRASREHPAAEVTQKPSSSKKTLSSYLRLGIGSLGFVF